MTSQDFKGLIFTARSLDVGKQPAAFFVKNISKSWKWLITQNRYLVKKCSFKRKIGLFQTCQEKATELKSDLLINNSLTIREFRRLKIDKKDRDIRKNRKTYDWNSRSHFWPFPNNKSSVSNVTFPRKFLPIHLFQITQRLWVIWVPAKLNQTFLTSSFVGQWTQPRCERQSCVKSEFHFTFEMSLSSQHFPYCIWKLAEIILLNFQMFRSSEINMMKSWDYYKIP